MGYDVIGDIHGQADKLSALLQRLGYSHRSAGWAPPQGRQAIFLGDLIDRGPAQLAVLETVKSMIDAGHARSVMGNHEFNAIGYIMPCRAAPGRFLREHRPENVAQHVEFLRQVGEGSPAHRHWVNWFRSLPPALDLGGIRVVHAWWHQPYIDRIMARLGDAPMDDDFLHAAFTDDSPEWHAMEGLTKGQERRLPGGHSFTDHGGHVRHHVRTRWWLQGAQGYRDIAIVSDSQKHRVPDLPLEPDWAVQPIDGAPIFVGHYWMTGTPTLQSPKVACVDYSAARDGPLVAYRWDGETTLDATHFMLSA